MAITDISISEELQTNAPSIKYTGNEGPKSPQEMEQMMADALLKDEYDQYVYDLLEQRPDATPMSFEEFKMMVIAEGQMSKGPVLPNDPTEPVNPFQPKPQGPVLPDRQMAAYGGIMGMDGRRQYGIGSSLKKFVRKVIPNEVADIAVKAAPFVAMVNPALAPYAALASGLGSFDKTGSISSGLKSGALTYGAGALSGGMGKYKGNVDPLFQGRFNISNLLGTPKEAGINIDKGRGSVLGNKYRSGVVEDPTGLFAEGEVGKNLTGNIVDEFANVQTGGQGLDNLTTKLSPLKKLGNKIMEYVPTSLGQLNPLGQNFDIKKAGGAFAIFKGVQKLSKMAPQETVSAIMERGEDLDIEGIRTEVLEAYKDPSGEKLKALAIKYPYIHQDKDVVNVAQGGRIKAQEGGLMDLGGMEKDYRAEGGFVPIGREEKADDVPARLSVNEFVFTADAVRNAGGGDIDKGAEVMENMMKHLEQGGQVSDESQGMAGAQQMFETSERLSEVI
jgi:hypothetical protein